MKEARSVIIKRFFFIIVVCLSVLTFSSCGGGSTGSGVSSDSDYNYLYRHNANNLGGYTQRWNSSVIQVSGATGHWKEAVDRWPTVSFDHVSSAPTEGNGIEILGYEDIGSTCGIATYSVFSSGLMASCKIRINQNIDKMNCGLKGTTMTHEVGHCLGFFGHTTDGGLMDKTATGSSEITIPVRNMISLLYSLNPGTDINSKISGTSSQLSVHNKKYETNGKKRYFGVIRLLENGVTQIDILN